MVNEKYITKDESDAAFSKIENYKFSQKDTAIRAPHFVFYIKEVIARQFGDQALETGGLQITTTLDYDIQKEAENIVKTEIDKLKGFIFAQRK